MVAAFGDRSDGGLITAFKNLLVDFSTRDLGPAVDMDQLKMDLLIALAVGSSLHLRNHEEGATSCGYIRSLHSCKVLSHGPLPLFLRDRVISSKLLAFDFEQVPAGRHPHR